MPFTEVIIPKFKDGPEVKAALEAGWPETSKFFNAQPPIIQAFAGSVIEENEQVAGEQENRPIWILEWTDVAAFHSFVASEDFAAFSKPLQALSEGPPALQIFDTDVGPSKVASSPLVEIIRAQLGNSVLNSPPTY